MDALTADFEIRDGIAIVRLTGQVTAVAWQAVFRDLLDQRDFTPETSTVWDYRETTGAAELKPTDFFAVGSTIRSGRTSKTRPRVAMLVATDLDFGMARMFELSSREMVPITVRVFRDEAEAILWAKTGQPSR